MQAKSPKIISMGVTISKIISLFVVHICNLVILLAFLLLQLVIKCVTPLIVVCMRIFGPKTSYDRNSGFYLVRHKPTKPVISKKGIGFVVAVIALSNFFTYSFTKKDDHTAESGFLGTSAPSLYLIDEASIHIPDVFAFEEKVKSVALELDIPAEWLMSVMYSESKFNPAAVNHKGSGATGLIQFMVPTVKDLNRKLGTNLYMSDIRNMAAVDQMDLVYAYLQNVRDNYGEFNTLTDLYLAILYPRAVGKDYCYTLYAKPSQKYRMNSGLDENRDGRVTVSDIDRRMARLYPTAYQIEKLN